MDPGLIVTKWETYVVEMVFAALENATVDSVCGDKKYTLVALNKSHQGYYY
ncbi:hypothetical protein [Aquimarina macrocephali]|uniref:hypothetical protein n=1 Tax=Aquimarina macrocephali TaxID=666563 RepID=UPI0004BC510C|nr:hypothetical protein [Aquimarina macrocephali]